MSFDDARKAKAESTSYKQALREARTVSVKLASKLMQDALDGKVQNADGQSIVPREAIAAMAEVLREAREVFGSGDKKSKKNKPGSPVDADALIASLEK